MPQMKYKDSFIKNNTFPAVRFSVQVSLFQTMSYFKKFTLAAYALEKANDQMAEISMRLKQLKHFLQFFCRAF
jgi:hypothetical protein